MTGRPVPCRAGPSRGAQLAGVAALALLAATGCYTTTIRSGLPAGRSPVGHDDRWHHGFVGGIGEASGPYDLNRICPHGWSEITTQTTFLTGLVTLVAGYWYTPQNVTIVCAAPGGAAGTMPPPPGYGDERLPYVPAPQDPSEPVEQPGHREVGPGGR